MTNYIVKMSMVETNLKLAKSIFYELDYKQVEGVKYSAYKMGENVFIHFATFDSKAAERKFQNLESFKLFSESIAKSVEEKPVVNEIEEVASLTS
jgi:hypothetical protein